MKKVCNLPLNQLYHDDKPAYVHEGHGGKLVWHWPVYHFFDLYYSGKKEEAEKSFAEWYMVRYHKYSEVANSQGGMKNGSLDRLYRKIPGDILFREAVHLRVNQRFRLFNEILESGYVPDYENPIRVIKRDHDQYSIISGHHRIAILAVLGHDIVPGIFVFRNNIMFMLHRGQQKLGRMLGARIPN